MLVYTEAFDALLTQVFAVEPVAVAAPAPKEGQTVESAGTRVRLYPNEVLRDGAAEFGVVWDPPGYPRGTRCPLFAQGRTGFQQSGTRVSHGGLSLDEVIVPFMQVTT